MEPSPALSLFRNRDFRLFAAARLLWVTAGQMVFVAIGWQVYQITQDALHLGFVGLAQFVPATAFAILAGQAADRYDRRSIMIVCVTASLGAAGLLAFQAMRKPSLEVIYAVSALFGVIRAFSGPASASLLPLLVTEEQFPRAVPWSLIVFQIGTVLGPAVGGLVYDAGRSAATVYAVASGLYLTGLACMLFMRIRPGARQAVATTLHSLLAGIRYVWRERILLGAMSLDLFAVLLGGATALLPIFAGEIFDAGARGLGILRSAPAVGAGAMAIFLAFRPLERRMGPVLFGGVAVFGLATVVFGLSRHFGLSVAALAVAGAADMLSVTIRHTLIQMATPDEMRGRVSAVAFVFIGASNELGEFESGVTARLFGAARSVVIGGIGTCAVVLLWSALFPRLRSVDAPPRPATSPSPPGSS
jgi:MFS family permease